MARSLNVLLFPGGTEVAMEIREALAHEKSVALYGASGDPFDPGSHLYRNYDSALPWITEPERCIESLAGLVRRWGIDYVFPAYDDVGLFVSAHRDRVGCRVVLPDHRTVEILRSKRRTFETLGGVVPCPRVYAWEEVRAHRELEVFIKPDVGQGSQGTFHLRPPIDVNLLDSLSRDGDRYVLCEYLPGEEYTVDCLSGADGTLLAVCPRVRRRTKAGIATFTSVVQGHEFSTFAENIAAALQLRGAWFYQVKRDVSGAIKLQEAAARISGTMALYRQTGINFPLLSLYIHEGIPVSVSPNAYDRLELSRTFRSHFRCELEFSRVYVDLDDTLLLRGKVNTKLVALIFQWINQGIPVVLISKHDGEIDQTLARYRLAGLFAQVVHLGRGDEKADHVTPGSIFIDDSFTEREKVRRRVGIPTFDLSMLDGLMDERV